MLNGGRGDVVRVWALTQGLWDGVGLIGLDFFCKSLYNSFTAIREIGVKEE